MPRRRLTTTAAALALCATVALCRPARADDNTNTTGAATAAVKADTSTPKAAASSFFKAMETGDTSAAKALASGSEKQLAVLDILVPVVSGFKQLEVAAVKKWGDEGRKTLTQGQGGAGTFDFNEKLKTAKEEVTGDVATITPVTDKPEDKKDPMKLKKVDGQWKLDMASIPADGLDDPNTTKMLKAMADIAKSTAAEIDQGKYPNAQAAKEAMGQKILPLILNGGAGAPGGAPEQPKKEEPKK
jgi:hypothetical protein